MKNTLIILLSLIVISCVETDSAKSRADESIQIALQHENEGASLSEDTGVAAALEYYLSQEPLDTLAVLRAARLTASHLWWIGEKEKAYKMLDDQIAAHPDASATRSAMLNFLVLDGDYSRMEKYLEQSDNTEPTFRQLHELAVVKFYNDEPKESIRCYEKAFSLVSTKEDSTILWGLALPAYADILSYLGDHRKAIDVQDKILEFYRGKDASSEALSYASLARYHLLLGDFVQARRYENLALSVKNEAFDSDLSRSGYLQVLSILLDYAETANADIKEWALFVNSLGDKAMVAQKITDAKREANWILAEQNLQITIKRQKEQMLFIALTFIFIITILGLLLWLRNRRYKLVEKEEELDSLRKLLSESYEAIEDRKDDRFFKKILLQQLGIIRMAASNPTTANQDLLKRMKEITSQEVNVDALLSWKDLYQTIDYIYDGFYTSLMEKFGTVLNEKEIQLCCLLKANFSTKEISVVTQQSVQTVYQRKSTIRQTLNMPEAEDIVSFITNK